VPSRRRPSVGNIVQFELPHGRYAYGRVLRDASVAFYAEITKEPQRPPVGSREFQFVVGVYDDVLRAAEVVGLDPSTHEDEDWPPPRFIRDPIGGCYKIYERGEMRDATANECVGLERAAVWGLSDLIERLSTGRRR
jgi:hypothetical protein